MSVITKTSNCDISATTGLITGGGGGGGGGTPPTLTKQATATRELLAYSTSNNSASNNSCASSTAAQQQQQQLQRELQLQREQQQQQHRNGLIQLGQATGGSTPSKIVRILTVLAYMVAVSMAAILLSLYYTFIWNPYDLRPLETGSSGRPFSVQSYPAQVADGSNTSSNDNSFDLLPLRVLPNRSSSSAVDSADANEAVVIDDYAAAADRGGSNSPVDVFYPLSPSSSLSSSTSSDQDQIVSYTSYTSSSFPSPSSFYPSTSRKPSITSRLKGGGGDRVARLVMSRGARSAVLGKLTTPKRTSFTSAKTAASFTVLPSEESKQSSKSTGSLLFRNNGTSQR